MSDYAPNVPLTDAELVLLMDALESHALRQREAYAEARALSLGFVERDFGLPAIEALNTRLAAAYNERT